MPAKFEIITMEPQNTNSVLMVSGSDAVIFDAWGRAEDWRQLLDERHLRLRAIYSTHGHGDHIAAAAALAAHYQVPWFLNPADNSLIEWSRDLLEYFHLPAIESDDVSPTPIQPGQIDIQGNPCVVIAAPGHSAGGMAYYFPDAGILIIGDTLFANGVGRCDLPGGDVAALQATISTLLAMNLPDETFVIPGHGIAVTWGEMRHANPCLKPHHCGAGHCGCGSNHAGGTCGHGDGCCGQCS